MKSITISAAFFSGALIASGGFAGISNPEPPITPPSTGSVGDNEDTSLFVGLNWAFGTRSTVEGVVGVVHSQVDAGGDVEGGRFSVHFDLRDLQTPPDARLTGILGDEDIAAEAGLGIGFDGSPFAVLGGIGNYYNFGGTLGFDGTLGGYVGTHSYGKFDDKPSAPEPPRRPVID